MSLINIHTFDNTHQNYPLHPVGTMAFGPTGQPTQNSNWLTRSLRFSINERLIDKIRPNDIKDYADGFVSQQLTIGELVARIKQGYAYSSQFRNGYRQKINFEAADIVSVDIDGGMTIEQALELPLVQRAATMIYTTASHQSDNHRFRIVFALPRTITDSAEFHSVMRSLALRLKGDNAAVDPARMFFGNRDAEVYQFDRGMDDALLEELIEQSVALHQKAREGSTVRSHLRITADLPITAANGVVGTLADFPKGQPVHCPYHNDRRPSAFIIENRNGHRGIHCSASACRTSFWSCDDVYDFYSFEREAKKASKLIPVRPFEQLIDHLENLDPNHNEVHFFNRKHVKDLPLIDGISLINSPKGSGKTKFLAALTQQSSDRILLIGHRQSLIRKMCKELHLNCYLDDKLDEFKSQDKKERQSRYGVCLDSLAKVDLSVPYDYILIDESEQVLAHFLSKTMEAKRNHVLHRLIHLIGHAKRIIALDADLSWPTYNFITRWARTINPQKPSNIYINEYHTDRDTLQLIGKKDQIIGEIHQAIEQGKKIFVVSNSREQVHELEAAIRNNDPDVSLLAVTSSTVQSDEDARIRNFINDPECEAKNYQVVLASPSLGTGIDITFDGDEQYFDIVFGIFMADITSHFDCDQQLARVRHPRAIKVFISPRQFTYETNIDVTRKEILETMQDRLLKGYTGDGQPIYDDGNDSLLELVTAVISHRRASINRLKRNFIDYKIREGWKIEKIEDDQQLITYGESQSILGKTITEKQAIDRLMLATSLTDEQNEEILQRFDGGQYVSYQQRADFARSSIERFYNCPITRDLIALDDKGRYRGKVNLFEAATNKRWYELRELFTEGLPEPRSSVKRLIRNPYVAETMFIEIMQTLPVYGGGEFLPDHAFSMDDLGEFVDYVNKYRVEIEAQFKMNIRKDFYDKPMRMAGDFMRMAGLSWADSHTKTINGVKKKFMKINPEMYQKMKDARKNPSATA
jgi:hypothetical protein